MCLWSALTTLRLLSRIILMAIIPCAFLEIRNSSNSEIILESDKCQMFFSGGWKYSTYLTTYESRSR